MPGAVLGAGGLGGLIAFEKGDRAVVTLLARAHETSAEITVPATALAQAIRNPQRQVRLIRLLRAPLTSVASLDRSDAVGVGRLLAGSGTADIVDAHIVVCAHRARQRVVTSDPEDLRRLDPELEVIRV